MKDTVVPQIAKITLQGDRVEEIIVVEDLYDVVAEAMESAPLPTDFPDQQGIARDQVEVDFREYCKSIVIRTAAIEHLAVPDPESIPPEVQFIRPVTMSMKIQGYIEHWDGAIGFTESLRVTGCPVSFTFNEKKMIFGLLHAMNLVATMQARQVQTAGGGKVQMFDMN